MCTCFVSHLLVLVLVLVSKELVLVLLLLVLTTTLVTLLITLLAACRFPESQCTNFLNDVVIDIKNLQPVSANIK